jgi:hypothetical protein
MVAGIAAMFIIGFGVAAFIAWWSMRGETYRRRG